MQQQESHTAIITKMLLIGCSFIHLLIFPSSIVCSEAKFISEFTLDDLDNVPSSRYSHQPLSFGSHSRLGGLEMATQSEGAARAQQNHATSDRLAVELSKVLLNNKRGAGTKTCHPTKPFLCPSDEPQGGECIPIQYLCDGSSDCPAHGGLPGGYDEDPLLCTAKQRLPVEETANFLRTLIQNHGIPFIEKLFGPKVSQALTPLGGLERVAIALSVSKTIEDFGKALHLMRGDIDHLRNVLIAVQTMDGPMLENLGIARNTNELSDMKLFLEKLVSTGFLD